MALTIPASSVVESPGIVDLMGPRAILLCSENLRTNSNDSNRATASVLVAVPVTVPYGSLITMSEPSYHQPIATRSVTEIHLTLLDQDMVSISQTADWYVDLVFFQ